MGAAAIEVATLVHLELQAVNDPRFPRLGLGLQGGILALVFLGGFQFLQARVAQNKDQTLPLVEEQTG